MRRKCLKFAMSLGLSEQAGKAVEHLQVGGNDGVVKGHEMLFLRRGVGSPAEMGLRPGKNNRWGTSGSIPAA